MPRSYAQSAALADAAALDALAYFTSVSGIEAAAAALDNGDFAAWDAETSAAAAHTLRTLADCYHNRDANQEN